jgi:8-oxo-dGTP diphosphatase
MKREYPDAPLVGIGAVIIERDRVVLVQRGHAPLLGEWSIPGGAVELGETVREAVIREAREETGLDVKPIALLGVFDRIVQDEDGGVRYHYVLVDFLCRRVSGELRAACDCDGAQWFTAQAAADILSHGDTQEVVRSGFEQSANWGSGEKD